MFGDKACFGDQAYQEKYYEDEKIDIGLVQRFLHIAELQVSGTCLNLDALE